MISAVNLLVTSFFKIIFSIACSLKNSQNFFMQSLPQYTSCLFSMFLNDDTVDTEKPDGICLPTFFINEFSGLIHQSFLLNIQDVHK